MAWFRLLFLVAQWAFGSLSPRLNLFRDDPIVWRSFGLAIGVWVFSVTAALAIGNDPKVSVIVPVAEVVAAPPQRTAPIAWRLRHVEELTAANFPVLWRNIHQDEE